MIVNAFEQHIQLLSFDNHVFGFRHKCSSEGARRFASDNW